MSSLPLVFRFSVGAAAVATFVAVVLRAIDPFDHGIWLVSYLFLVGTAAQYLLARGQVSVSPGSPFSVVRTEALLWSVGVVAVPLGVLCDLRILVAVGSVTLLVALFLFRRTTTHRARPALAAGGTGTLRAYSGLLAFMTLSVFVGMALASDIPWS